MRFEGSSLGTIAGTVGSVSKYKAMRRKVQKAKSMAKARGTVQETLLRVRPRPRQEYTENEAPNYTPINRREPSPKSAQNTAVRGAASTFLAFPPNIVVDKRSLAAASRTKTTLQGWILNDDGALGNDKRGDSVVERAAKALRANERPNSRWTMMVLDIFLHTREYQKSREHMRKA